MSWAIGSFEGRDIGYGVPAICDHPDCNESIDRGLGYVCGNGQPWGDDEGCGLFFCMDHGGGTLCERCQEILDTGDDSLPIFQPKPDVPEWINHKLTDQSWQRWRDENLAEVARLDKTRLV
jgi:hypothetical protein